MFKKLIEQSFHHIYDSVRARLKAYLNYFLIFLSLALSVSLIRNILKINKAGKKIEEAQVQLEEIKEENRQLKLKVESLASEEYVERQLREKLSLSKEGEIIVVLPEEEILRKLAPKRELEEDILPDPNWKRWYKLFF